MARSAHDAALMLNAMVGFDRRDSSTVDRPPEDFTATLAQGVQGLRVAVPRTYFNEGLQPDVERAWRSAVETLVGLGAAPVEVGFSTLDEAIPAGQQIVRSEMTVFHADWFARQPEDYSPDLVARFREAGNWSAVDLVRAQRAREPIRADLWAALDNVDADVLVVPVMAGTATPIGAEASVADLTRFTYPFNLSGFPSLSVPCGLDQQGMPIGIQLAARPWQEGLLFRVGHAYQQATDWHLRRPSAIS
jgi:aspartyl-tRNA(Asn)/glutamyl-tRNA(Gln) amidotransferase subunit A